VASVLAKFINVYKVWREQRWYKLCWLLVKLTAACLIIYLLLNKVQVKREDFAGVGLCWIVAAFAVIFLQSLLTGVRWWALLRANNCRATLFEAVSLTMQGLFFTLFIPGGTVSGDVCKAALIAARTPENKRFNAAFSVLIDRVCGLCGLMMLASCAAIITLIFYPEPSPWFRRMMLLTMIAVPVFLGCAVMAFRCDLILKIRLFRKLYDWLNKLSGGAVARIEEALAAYRTAWKTVLLWSLISGFLLFPLIALGVWFICMGIPACGALENISGAIGSLLAGSIGELAGILPLTPGGIGVRDAVFVEIFKACGIDPVSSTQIPIIFTVLFMLTNSSGGLFLLYSLLKKRSKK
jgi:uncharacterized protein (TIRG00374 family)